MKWLLITTTENRNTGDELIRIGIQNLIKNIDDHPEFILLDKEKPFPDLIEFDKCILCGMPLFWNNKISTSQEMGWWGAIMNGWVSERKKDFLILGVGSVIGSDGIKDLKAFKDAVRIAIYRSFKVTVRDGSHQCDNELIPSVCPSIFAIEKASEPLLRLCNIMPDGAHDKHFNPDEAAIWKEKMKLINNFFLDNDFYFICHSNKDVLIEDPESLGWQPERIIRFYEAEEYVNIYSHAQCFIGNRVHGALLTGSLGRPSLAIGYDSRLLMLENFNVQCCYPSEIFISDLKRILNQANVDFSYLIENEKKSLIKLLTSFAEA